MKSRAAVCAAAVVLTMTSACGAQSPAQPQGVGALGVISGPPSGPPSPPPSGPGSATPSPSHSTTRPKPKPDPKPPTQNPGPDYSVSTASQPLGACAWKFDSTSGFSVYQITVTTSYVGPSTDPNERYQIQDGDGDVLVDDMIGINAKRVTITVPDRFDHTSDYTERLMVNLWYQGGPDTNENDDTSTVKLSIPYSSSPSDGTFKPVPCTH